MLVSLHDKDRIAAFARGNPALYLYALGDLDEFYWRHTTWYALEDGGAIRALALLYGGVRMPALLALCEPPERTMRQLLRALLPLLPARVYASLMRETARTLEEAYDLTDHGLFHRMALTAPDRARAASAAGVERLGLADESAVRALYDASYPDTWFVPRMLETGLYRGVRRRGALVAVAGVHVASGAYDVAALGNVATHPDWRGRGLATAATASLCQDLLAAGIGTIGLNVRADNASALACYTRLGFTRVAAYGEYTAVRRVIAAAAPAA